MAKPIVEVNGEKCIIFVHQDPGHETATYVVPLDVAAELDLISYDGEEVDRDDRLLRQLEDYEVENIWTYTTQ